MVGTAKANSLYTVMLVVFCAIVAGVVTVEVLYPPQLVKSTHFPQDTAPVTPEIQPLGGFDVASLGKYNEIIERPLFLSTRRPPEKQPEEPPEPSPEPPSADETFTLLGVVLTPEATIALLQDDKSGEIARLQVGEQVNGWHLKAVQANSVSLSKGDQAVDLPLVRDRSQPAPQARRQTPKDRLQALRDRRKAIMERRRALRERLQAARERRQAVAESQSQQ
jgi:hypothetical protein